MFLEDIKGSSTDLQLDLNKKVKLLKENPSKVDSITHAIGRSEKDICFNEDEYRY